MPEQNSVSPPPSPVVPAVLPQEESGLWDDMLRRLGECVKTGTFIRTLPIAVGVWVYRNKGKPTFNWWTPVVVTSFFAIGIVVYSFCGAAYAQIKRLLTTPGEAPSPPLPAMASPVTHLSDQFWLLFDSRPTGPFSCDELLAAARRGDFAWESLVCRVGTQDWASLRTFDTKTI